MASDRTEDKRIVYCDDCRMRIGMIRCHHCNRHICHKCAYHDKEGHHLCKECMIIHEDIVYKTVGCRQMPG